MFRMRALPTTFAYVATKLLTLLGLSSTVHAEATPKVESSLLAKLAHIQSAYGIPGDHGELIKLSDSFHEQPKPSQTGKTKLTFNNTGFDVLDAEHVTHNWVIQDALTHCNANKQLLDIGGGYGAITKDALSKGTTVVYNDLCDQHLIIGYQGIDPAYRSKITLNNQAVEKLELPENSFDIIVAHRILHFLPPKDVEQSIANFAKWLKPNGRLYIVTLSPTHIAYRDSFLPTYNQKWKDGNEWPGYPLNTQDALPAQAYALPKTLHVMDERPLRKALEKNGLTVAKTDYVSTKKLGVEKDRDGRESFGIIAQKPRLK